MPAPWVILGLGLAAGWFGLTVSILAIGHSSEQATDITLGTTQGFAALAGLWVIVQLLEEDRTSGLRIAADATRPGGIGRVLGRWSGAMGVALVVSLTMHVGLILLAGASPSGWLYLHSANILSAALLVGWGAVLAPVLRGGAAVLAGMLAWLLGHLPWGSPTLLPGPLGQGLKALLPGPRPPGGVVEALGYTSAAAAGLLLLALALEVRPRPGA